MIIYLAAMHVTVSVHSTSRNYSLHDRQYVFDREIRNWLTCDLLSLSLNTARDPFHQQFTRHMKTFRACILRYNNIQTFGKLLLRQQSPKSVRACLETIINVCKTTPALVMKFIRLQMETVLEYLPHFPNMKVIHLIRDPRGMFNSRSKLGLANIKHGEADEIGKLNKDEVRRFCDLLHKDLSVSKFIQQHAPDRIRVIQYEDLAENPKEVATQLLAFTGLGLTPRMENFIKHMTSSSRDSCAFCTQRKNSAKTARKWRTEMKLNDAFYIYNTCEQSMNILGYLPLSTSFDMKNLMSPSTAKHNLTYNLINDNHF